MLHPPTIVRRTVSLETGNQHTHNHNRVATMQHKMYMDYINARKPAFYGYVQCYPSTSTTYRREKIVTLRQICVFSSQFSKISKKSYR